MKKERTAIAMGSDNPLYRHNFYKPFRKNLISEFGREEAESIWKEAGQELTELITADPSLEERNGAMVVPLVALSRALKAHGKDAEGLLNAFGDQRGEFFAKLIHVLTLTPGIDKLVWKNIDKIMHIMSEPSLGYRRRNVSEPPDMYGVDILSCPYHELAKELGEEKAVLCLCHMDKKYMQGFRHIRYERNTAVSEGAECCDYRLRYDRMKK
jgi:hypothetical protein